MKKLQTGFYLQITAIIVEQSIKFCNVAPLVSETSAVFFITTVARSPVGKYLFVKAVFGRKLPVNGKYVTENRVPDGLVIVGANYGIIVFRHFPSSFQGSVPYIWDNRQILQRAARGESGAQYKA